MARTRIPDGITAEHIRAAAAELDAGIDHGYGPSTNWDVIIDGKRYPPKPIVGLAVGHLTGTRFDHSDFSSGKNSRCFRILQDNGFSIVDKNGVAIDEVRSDDARNGCSGDAHDPFIQGRRYNRQNVCQGLSNLETRREDTVQTANGIRFGA